MSTFFKHWGDRESFYNAPFPSVNHNSVIRNTMSLESILADLVVAVNQNTEAAKSNNALLARALATNVPSAPVTSDTAAAVEAPAKVAKTSKAAKPSAPAVETPAAAAPVAETPPAKVETPAAVVAPEVTQQDIIDLATEVLNANGKDTAPLVALSEKFKIKRIRDIDAPRMGAMKAELLALLASAKAV